MGFLTGNNTQTQQLSERQTLEKKFAGARSNILLVLAFTALNVILLVTNSNTYFLFSAYIPFFCADLGMGLCGMYPEEVYGGDISGMEFMDKSFFAVMMAAAAVVLVLYLLSWIFTKKGKMGWMIFALVFFIIDTVALLALNGISMDWAVDYVFHAWVIFSLASGISAAVKLKKLPEEPELVAEEAQALPEEL